MSDPPGIGPKVDIDSWILRAIMRRWRAVRRKVKHVVVVLWNDVEPYGPWLRLLAAADDMGAARNLARKADLALPQKRDRIDRSHPLYAAAEQHPNELLWQVWDGDPGDDGSHQEQKWQIGADSARLFRRADAARDNSIRQAARGRRKTRE